MNPLTLLPYAERVQALGPEVRHDAFAGTRDAGALARRRALSAAAGRIHRYLEAVRALGGEPDAESDGQRHSDLHAELEDALVDARRTLEVAWRPAQALVGEAEASLRAAVGRARLAALSNAPDAPSPEPDAAGSDEDRRAQLARRLAWHGDPHVAAERLEVLDEADDAISLAAAAALSFERAPRALRHGGLLLQVARLVTAGLDDETRWRIEAAVRADALERELFTDPFGGPLWCGLLSPDRLPELLERAAQGGDVAEPPIALAAAGAPAVGSPGEVRVLLWNKESNAGFVTRLTVKQSVNGNLWGADARWGSVAWNAVRDAYYAAAALLPGGRAPDTLAGYTLEIDIDSEATIDGPSLGLPAALAFYSLWTGTPLPRNVGATGQITRGGDVRPVDDTGLDAKLHAWHNQFPSAKARVLIPDQATPHAWATRCISLAGALAVLGVTQAAVAPPSLLGDVKTRTRALEDCCHDVREQKLDRAPSIDGAGPWVLLADRMRLLIESLVGAPGAPEELDDARLWCALAYIHGTRSHEAEDMLQGVQASDPRRALLAALMRLNNLIDVPAAGEDAMDDQLAVLVAAEPVGPMRAQAVGTRGRFHLHRHRVDTAIPLLRESVDASPPYERGRSRVYLAMALRMSGAPEGALAQLELGEAELREHTLSFSRSYHDQTLMYLRYERARILLALGRPGDALASVDQALRVEGQAGGWWPRMGFLRARAVALLATGATAQWEACVAELRSLAEGADPAHHILVDGLVEEAHGRPASVVY